MARWMWLLVLPLLEVASWRHAERATSALQSSAGLIQAMFGTSEMEVLSSSSMEKVLCTRRLPYFRNRLCLQLKSHAAVLEGTAAALRGSSSLNNGTSVNLDKAPLLRALKNPLLALPDVTIDLAWMGCSTCVPEMRTCSANQICRTDPKDDLSYPWIRIFPLSLGSLVAGPCYGIADLLVSAPAAAAFAPLLGALAPYLAGLLGTLTGRIFDELLLGRYCIYLSTHLEKEVLGGQVLSQDSTCIDHMYTIHIPGIFGIVKARKFSDPGTPLVCWPTASEPGEALFTDVAESATDTRLEDSTDADDLEPPAIVQPADVLNQDKVCREGASENLCTACEVAIQAATWRLLGWSEKIHSARSLTDMVAETSEDEEDSGLELVESKMLIHANTERQCEMDRDVSGCLNDYSLCLLKTGFEDAEECEVKVVHVSEKTPFCWWLCNETSVCHQWSFSAPSCAVSKEYENASCLVEHRRATHAVKEHVQSSRFSDSHWVHCNPGSRPFYPSHWRNRMVGLYARLRRSVPDTTEETRAAAARQVLQRLSEPAPSAPHLSMLDVSLLRIGQLASNHSKEQLRTLLCQEVACCSSEHRGVG